MNSAIPIFAFHRVGPRRDCRFTVPLDIFEQYLAVVEEEGYTTLTCSDLVSIVAGRVSQPARACLLTFDDGYADVWVYGVPLLRRHGMRGTVFVILTRLGSNGRPRPTLEDAWSGHCSIDELYRLPEMRSINARALDPAYLPATDHLSWEEVRALARGGICEVQSHGLDHMVHYTSDRVRGFLSPFSHWTACAAARGDSRLGTPVYEINSTVVKPRYCDPKPLRDHLANVVARSGGHQFFTRTDWSEILRREFGAARTHVSLGHFEPEESWEGMVLDSLRACISVLSSGLGLGVECLAWPFGATTARAQEIALKAGFVLAFTTQCGGYVSGMPRARVGRVGLKDHDVEKFRLTLRRYSNANTIDEEMARAADAESIEIPEVLSGGAPWHAGGR
jgi:peptidoglycan/xylan/chitin deacetylase (PgdA/CDA1 family)